jgi:predicted secreted Zn-dependent protease
VFKAVSLALLLAGAPVIDTPVVDGVEITQALEHYPVTGNNARQILDALFASAPVASSEGRQSLGHTYTDLAWRYEMASVGEGRCRIEDVSVSLDIRIRLPEWQPARKPGKRLAEQWQAFIEGLTGHELQHRALALDAASAVRSVLLDLPEMPCKDARSATDRATRPIMQRLAADNRAYDARTQHGRTEGAYWLAR